MINNFFFLFIKMFVGRLGKQIYGKCKSYWESMQHISKCQ